MGGRRARAFEGRGAPRAADAMTGTRAAVPRARRDARTRALVRTCRSRRPVTWEVRRPPPIRSLGFSRHSQTAVGGHPFQNDATDR